MRDSLLIIVEMWVSHINYAIVTSTPLIIIYTSDFHRPASVQGRDSLVGWSHSDWA